MKKTRTTYQKFLTSNYWRKVRAKVIERDRKKCRLCGAAKFLQVHHKTYKHHGKEHLHLGDLITLCRKCHSKLH